jgi:predicted PurR-regulated permease PerM
MRFQVKLVPLIDQDFYKYSYMKNDLNTKGTLPYNPVIHYALQLIAVGLLLVWCFLILQPFIVPLIWAAVLATTTYPMHEALRSRLGNRNTLSATIITILMLLIIIGPATWLLLSTVGEMKMLGAAYRAGNLQIPPPDESVKTWPVIGGAAYANWAEASSDITTFISHHSEETKAILLKLLGLLRNTGTGVLIFAVSIIISGFLLGFAKPAGEFIRQLLIRIAGSTGDSMVEAATKTIRNVAKGVLGVALFQSILAGIGFVVAGIPFAGVWILVCLVLAIVQIGILPVSIGTIIWAWANATTTTAIVFTIWMILVGVSDNILKPIMMGKGAPAPILVVFLGAIGGFMVSGFIGLFTGAIVLTFGYNLMIAWVRNSPEPPANADLPSNDTPEIEKAEVV